MKTRTFEVHQTVFDSGDVSYTIVSRDGGSKGTYEFWEDACDVLSRFLAKTDKEVYHT